MNRSIVLQCAFGIMFSTGVLGKVMQRGSNEESGSISSRKETSLFDFTRLSSVSNWVEQSDTVRTVGMSKAALVLQQTQVFRRAVFFCLLNPQPNGAGFAGVRVQTALDLHMFSNISMRVRGQGSNTGYKIVLRHRGLDDEPHPTYEQVFTVTLNEFQVVDLPLEDFKPYYRGRRLNNTDPLDTSNITSFGLQVYGGVYLPIKQAGPSTLEIDWIKAVGDTDQQGVQQI